MFCPKCRGEYRPGFLKCADCGRKLAARLPPLPPPPRPIRYEKLLSTHNPTDIAFIRSILDAAGIVYFLRNENFSRIHILLEPVDVLVDADRMKEAQTALAGFNPLFFRISKKRKASRSK